MPDFSHEVPTIVLCSPQRTPKRVGCWKHVEFGYQRAVPIVVVPLSLLEHSVFVCKLKMTRVVQEALPVFALYSQSHPSLTLRRALMCYQVISEAVCYGSIIHRGVLHVLRACLHRHTEHPHTMLVTLRTLSFFDFAVHPLLCFRFGVGSKEPSCFGVVCDCGQRHCGVVQAMLWSINSGDNREL